MSNIRLGQNECFSNSYNLNVKEHGRQLLNYLERLLGDVFLSVARAVPCLQHPHRQSQGIIALTQDIWLINQPLPQYCIIDTSQMADKPLKVFNRVGFDCWHQYDSNPQLIEIAFRGSDEEEWMVCGKLRLNNMSGKQYFKVREVPVTQMKQLKVTIVENYNTSVTSKPITYLNQIELGFLAEHNLPQSRDKTFSECKRLTSTEKELKKSQEQVQRMATEQEDLKNIVSKQQALIIEMQQNMKIMAKELERVKKVQEIHRNKMALLGHQQQPHRMGTDSLDDEEDEAPSDKEE